MRALTCVAVLLLAALPLRAAEEPKSNTLTPKEIAEGWILLFDGESTFGWKVNGDARVENGTLVLGGQRETKATPTSRFSACDARLGYRVDNGAAKVFFDSGSPRSGEGGFSLVGGKGSVLTLHVEADTTGPANLLEAEVKHHAASDKPSTVDARIRHGKFLPTLRFELPAGSRLFLHDVKFRPIRLKSIFNGKDLTGWKKYEGDARRSISEFTVSDKGDLSLKNGPGDLQTTRQWSDFVLQLECISNGKHLNSGVFFRCIPGQYQNGYEAQIQNGFTKDPPREYPVEEYDPKTHKLVGKKTVQSAADDYGTGAIYRRMPARFAVAKDHEWFTMTVVADGRHIATWVNGIQQVDWTDNRPLNDNPRNGCRLEKGPISLQGHDRTTNLCFRNIRIEDLPPAVKK
jgi:hypothetical protein